MPIEKFAVFADDQQYLLQGADADLGDPPYKGGNGLVWVNPKGDVAVLHTGTDTGEITVTLEVLTAAPHTVDVEDWQEVVETSIALTGGTLAVCGPHDYESDTAVSLSAPADGAGWRLRVHARGRDLARDNAWEDDVLEEHLLQLWPAPSAPEIRHKLTDNVGQAFRDR